MGANDLAHDVEAEPKARSGRVALLEGLEQLRQQGRQKS
jgi:hypothetical protein